MKTPREIIENIRKTRFGIGLETEGISEDIKPYIEDSKKFKEDTARLGSDIYTEKPHFILELIQNAEDNDYEEGIKPKIKFIVQENQLILQNDEKGFDENNVSALCGIGQTTKKDIMVFFCCGIDSFGGCFEGWEFGVARGATDDFSNQPGMLFDGMFNEAVVIMKKRQDWE